MSFIQIVEGNEPFEWHPPDEGGRDTETVFTLRVLTEDQMKALRKKHTHMVFKHGQRSEEFDAFGFGADVVDQALVDWKGVLRAKTGAELPCTREYKVQLPERLKIEVIRLCAGKEAGAVVSGGAAEEEDEAPAEEKPDPNGR